MKKRIVLILLFLAVATAGVYAYRGMNRQPENRIVVSGNIELTEVNIAFKTSGRLIERNVDEGDSVKKGQVIARLDRDQLLAQRDAQAATLSSSGTQLEQARTSLAWQKASLAADIEQRKGDLDAAEARLAEMKNGSRPQEKLDAKADRKSVV
jgi:HlyD family secretion protein